jgi:hypothetical protein
MGRSQGTPCSSQLIWAEGRIAELEQQLAECKGLAQKWNDYYRGLHHPRCDLLEAAGFETLGNKCTCLECIREDVSKELAEANETLKDHGEIQADLCRQLAECQAREKVLRDAFIEISENATSFDDEWCGAIADEALAIPSDSTALDQAIRQAKREALLEAADWFERTEEFVESGKDIIAAGSLRNRAKELE